MQTPCSVCGTIKTINPSSLTRRNVTEDEYVCKNCYNKRDRSKNKPPDWSYFRKLKKAAEVMNK